MYRNYIEELNLQPEEILVYLRKSRADDPLLSVEEVLAKHETMLDEWAEKNLGAKIPEKNKYREVVSGETIADRPEIQNIFKRIESPMIKAVLTVEVQRLSRGDLEDAGRTIKLLRYTNTLVITLQKTYDIRDEYDRDAFERELKRGNEFLEYQKKIMNRGKELSVSQGNYIGSVPPYGYDKIFITEGRKKCPVLAINGEQANVVRMIFDSYVNKNMGISTIATMLDNMHITPPKGIHWSRTGVREMLGNIHYIGKIKWNVRNIVTIVDEGEIRKTRPKSKVGEFMIFDGKHEAIISDELFNAAQEKKGKTPRKKKSADLRNPLAGLIFCRCGRAMSLRVYKRQDGIERCARRLSCEDQTHCKTSSCLYDEMIVRISEILEKCIADFELRLNSNNEDSVKLHATLIKDLEKKLKNLEAKELSQWETQSSPNPQDRMPQEIFRQLNEKLLQEKERVRQALCEAYDSMPNPIDYEEKIAKFKDALNALHSDEADASEKNRLLKACIERIEYYRAPQERIKRLPGEKKGEVIKRAGGKWTTTPIELEVNLKV